MKRDLREQCLVDLGKTKCSCLKKREKMDAFKNDRNQVSVISAISEVQQALFGQNLTLKASDFRVETEILHTNHSRIYLPPQGKQKNS